MILDVVLKTRRPYRLFEIAAVRFEHQHPELPQGYQEGFECPPSCRLNLIRSIVACADAFFSGQETPFPVLYIWTLAPSADDAWMQIYEETKVNPWRFPVLIRCWEADRAPANLLMGNWREAPEIFPAAQDGIDGVA